jgi:hypothetical protein
MAIAEFIRDYTFEVRNSLNHLNEEITKAKSERDAAEERRRRATTEISKHRESERDTKRKLDEIKVKTSELRQALEEIDQKRAAIIDSLFESQERLAEGGNELRAMQAATEKALGDIKKEEKSKHEAEGQVFQLQSEQEKAITSLELRLRGALVAYLKKQTDQLAQAFLTEEQRIKERREHEEFEKARHSDPEVAQLCEQREELNKFIVSAMVPAVKETLQASLKLVEDRLKKLYPCAIVADDFRPRDSQIGELLYFINQEGNAVLLLPISEIDWANVEKGESGERASRAMCLVWSMIRELNLKEQDGSFLPKAGFIAFETCLGPEEGALLRGFGVKCGDIDVLRLVPTAIPAELQEVLAREN